MAKGCHECPHLEWVDGEDDGSSGWDCNKRHEQMYAAGRERELLNNLERTEYRMRFKRCFEPKAVCQKQVFSS